MPVPSASHAPVIETSQAIDAFPALTTTMQRLTAFGPDTLWMHEEALMQDDPPNPAAEAAGQLATAEPAIRLQELSGTTYAAVAEGHQVWNWKAYHPQVAL